jgi:hypothetical protein
MKATNHDDIEGGESACYAHLLCPECGGVLDAEHRSMVAVPDMLHVAKAFSNSAALERG